MISMLCIAPHWLPSTTCAAVIDAPRRAAREQDAAACRLESRAGLEADLRVHLDRALAQHGPCLRRQGRGAATGDDTRRLGNGRRVELLEGAVRSRPRILRLVRKRRREREQQGSCCRARDENQRVAKVALQRPWFVRLFMRGLVLDTMAGAGKPRLLSSNNPLPLFPSP